MISLARKRELSTDPVPLPIVTRHFHVGWGLITFDIMRPYERIDDYGVNHDHRVRMRYSCVLSKSHNFSSRRSRASALHFNTRFRCVSSSLTKKFGRELRREAIASPFGKLRLYPSYYTTVVLVERSVCLSDEIPNRLSKPVHLLYARPPPACNAPDRYRASW